MKARGLYFLTSCSATQLTSKLQLIMKRACYGDTKDTSLLTQAHCEPIRRVLIYLLTWFLKFLGFQHILSHFFLLDSSPLKTIVSFNLKCVHSTIQWQWEKKKKPLVFKVAEVCPADTKTLLSDVGCQGFSRKCPIQQCAFIISVRDTFLIRLKGQRKKRFGTPLQCSCLENPMDGGAR